ncbi:hypothetical protein D9V84_00185 [Bacteroidetes/Chlorobi group bacterium Naka2016]|jgi:hypothetical protein|nr:MAG: hypothetical protein D9V84_00185 [Bacteroidetes/Chlorobi group bacterium Naka2016]
MKAFGIFFCLFLCTSIGFSQLDLPQLLELLYEETGKTKTIDEVEFYMNYKIELVKENVQKISDLLGVNRKTATRIISLSAKGMSFNEICDSLNLLSSQCELIKLCTKVKETSTKRNSLDRGNENNGLILDLKSRFYTNFVSDTSYLGDNMDSYQRLIVLYKNFSLGVSLNKDIGEESYFNDKKYFLSFDNSNYRVILGRFVFKSFWGNVLGEPYGIYKGSNPAKNSFANTNKIKPTTSALDWGTFNGVAFATNWNLSEIFNLNLNGFVSLTNRSGNFDTSIQKVTSIYTMGYFRDSNELRKKDVLKENGYFFQLVTNTNTLSFGYSIFSLNYDKYLETSSKRFPIGKGNLYHSLFYDVHFWNSIHFSSEISIDKEKKLGLVSGIKYEAKRFASTICVRYFSKDFRSPFGSMLGENSYPNNEFGVFYSFEMGGENVSLQFYTDFYKSLSPTNLLQIPYRGQDLFIQLLFEPFENSSLRFRLKREDKTDYVYNVQKTNQIPFPKVKYQLLVEHKFNFLKTFTSTQRLDLLYLNNRELLTNETGMHFCIDLSSKILQIFELGSRYNYFSTTSYSSAIYVFEIIAPEYMLSVPFYGKGWRLTSWVKLSLFKYLNLYFKHYYQSNLSRKNFVLFQIDFNYFF